MMSISEIPAFCAMTNLVTGGFPGSRAISLHSVHYADANEVEIAINERFLKAIVQMFGTSPICDVTDAMKAFVDFILEARTCERLISRGAIYQTPDLSFSLRDLLLHVPLQHWPLPHKNHCPCSFCDMTPNPEEIEDHLRARYFTVFQGSLFHAEVQIQVTSLLGIGFQVRKAKLWRCPFSYCEEQFDRYSNISEHIRDISKILRQS
jgi:hypothetical protein